MMNRIDQRQGSNRRGTLSGPSFASFERKGKCAVSEDNLVPLVLYAGAVLLIVGGMVGLPWLLGERHRQKRDRVGERGTALPFESGMLPTGTARLRLPLQYYLAAMLFVVFDVEAVFIYAWAIAVPETGWLGFGEIAVFIAILLAALAYLWRVGALNWGAQYERKPRGKEARQREREPMVA